MRKVLAGAVVSAPIVLALIAVIAFLHPRLMIEGLTADIIGYLFIASCAVGFIGSVFLAIFYQRYLWLIATISTTLLGFLNILMSAGLAVSRMH